MFVTALSMMCRTGYYGGDNPKLWLSEISMFLQGFGGAVIFCCGLTELVQSIEN
jgi:hypothetical protein